MNHGENNEPKQNKNKTEKPKENKTEKQKENKTEKWIVTDSVTTPWKYVVKPMGVRISPYEYDRILK